MHPPVHTFGRRVWLAHPCGQLLGDVRASQRRRLYLKEAAMRSGHPVSWDFQASRDDSRRFVRAHGAAGAKARARFPFVPPL